MTVPTDPKGRTQPGFDVHAFICGHERPEGATRPSCGHRGSMTLLKHMKASLRERSVKNVRIQKSGCLDHCEFGPMCVVYPQGTWYRLMGDEDLEKVLNHLETNQPQSGAFVRLTDS